MKHSKFTDSQIIEALKRVEGGLAVPELCREVGLVQPPFISGVPNMVAWKFHDVAYERAGA